MSLTIEQEKLRDTDRLEDLLAELRRAVRIDDAAAISSAIDKIAEFGLDTRFQELRDRGLDATLEAAGPAIAGRVSGIAAIVAEIAPAGSDFERGIEIAESGEESLLFPRIASVASRAVDILDELKTTVETMKANVEAAGKQFEKADDIEEMFEAVKGALDLLEDMRDQARSLGGGS